MMKRHGMLYAAVVLIILLISGCSASAGNTPDKKQTNERNAVSVKKLENYETVQLQDEQDKNMVKMLYPKFGYAPLDNLISNEMENVFRAHQQPIEEFMKQDSGVEGIEEHFQFTRNFKAPVITKDFVSIYFEDYTYSGGAHGTPTAYVFNYDLKNDRMMTIHDVMKQHHTNLQKMADLTADDLINNDAFAPYHEGTDPASYEEIVKDETMPTERNYSQFTLDKDGITFYWNYFSPFPLAAGVTPVHIAWDDVKNASDKDDSDNLRTFQSAVSRDSHILRFGDPIEAGSALKYVNKDYHFSLKLPSSWKGKYAIRNNIENYFGGASEEPEQVISFDMVENGTFIGSLFTVEIFKGVSKKDLEEEYMGGPGFEKVFAEKDDIVLVSSRPGQMPELLYRDAYKKTGEQFSAMVEKDMPKILKSVKWKK